MKKEKKQGKIFQKRKTKEKLKKIQRTTEDKVDL